MSEKVYSVDSEAFASYEDFKHTLLDSGEHEIGDIVEVTNVKDMKFSGKKLEDKQYHRNTGYPSGIRSKKLGDMMKNEPQEVLKKMVFNMLPVNRLRANMIKRLKIS